jgi:DNA mismatch repair protein MutS
VTNLHVSVREWNDEVVFLHRIVPGRTDRSYGIHVARLAGLPPTTIARAKEVLELLGKVEVAHALATGDDGPSDDASASVAIPARRVAEPPTAAPLERQLSLFGGFATHPLVEELRSIDLNTLTPLAAFDLLRRLSDRARDGT